ncbi:hypothetical protein [Halomarina rubra]|uniref:Uncharacterized protein n=1 Tax=Halomarina rubra TaxID=2071873 RepID=A0ABD6AUN0_9EURY|nr:hypothetical protein [Halomarina rubra]
MNWKRHCRYCGRLPLSGDDPHFAGDTCPFEHAHEKHGGGDTLLEAVQKTAARNSVCLLGWCGSYPLYRTVFKTRSWLETFDTGKGEFEGHERYDTTYFRKTIWATSNVHQSSKYSRIEYDPTKESLITWYDVENGSETEGSGAFDTYIRSDKPDISFFGSMF